MIFLRFQLNNLQNFIKILQCTCTAGYTLDPTPPPQTPTKCKALNRTLAFLVISNRRSILLSDLNEHSIERLPVLVENVVATASDMSRGIIFWSDMKLKKIFRVNRNGSELKEVISNGLDLVEGIAFDWVGRNLYWVDSRLHTLEATDEWGKHRVVVLSRNVSQPRGIVLDPDTGWVFFSGDFCEFFG